MDVAWITWLGLPLAALLTSFCAAGGTGQDQPAKGQSLTRLGSSSLRHASETTGVSFAHDGKYLISAGLDGTIRTWAIDSGKEVARIETAAPIVSFALSPDSAHAATGDERGSVTVWELKTGKAILVLKQSTLPVRSISFSSDGNLLAVAAGETVVRIVDTKRGLENLQLLGHTETVSSVAFGPANIVVSGSKDCTVRMWESASGKEIASFRDKSSRASVTAVSCSPDGKTIAATYEDAQIRTWAVESGEMIKLPVVLNNALTVAFSSNGLKLAAGGQRMLVVWDLGQKGELFRVDTSREVRLVAFSPDGRKIASAGQPLIRVWDAATGKPISDTVGHEDEVWSIAWSQDGRKIASGGRDYGVVWDVATGKPLRTYKGHRFGIKTVAFLSHESVVASGGFDGTIQVWKSEREEHGTTLANCDGIVMSVAVSRGGKYLASGDSSGTVSVWEIGTGVRRFKSAEKLGPVNAVDFSSDANHLFVASELDGIRSWELKLGESRHLGQHEGSSQAVAVAPNGEFVISGGTDKILRMWATANPSEICKFRGHAKAVLSVALSRDGRYAASGSSDGAIRLWELASGREICCWEPKEGAVRTLSFSPNGASLAAGTASGSILIWNPNPVGKPASKEEWKEAFSSLSSEDVARAHASIYRLVAGGDPIIPWIREQPVPVVPDDNVPKLLDQLEDVDVSKREAAIEKLAWIAEPSFIDKLASQQGISDELRRSLKIISREMRSPRVGYAPGVAVLRLIEVLERVGSPQALEMLRELGAKGAERQRRGAKEALRRLDARQE